MDKNSHKEQQEDSWEVTITSGDAHSINQSQSLVLKLLSHLHRRRVSNAKHPIELVKGVRGTGS